MESAGERRERKGTEEWEDLLLAALVAGVNKAGDGLGVTLAIGGMLVSGQLISAAAFMDGIHVPAEVKDVIARGASDEDAPLPAYIHLKDARFYQAGGSAPPIPGNAVPTVYFRAKLSSVDGFTPGALAAVATSR